MLHEVISDKFIEIFSDVKPTKLPSKFTQSKQTNAFAKTLVVYLKYQKALNLKGHRDCETESRATGIQAERRATPFTSPRKTKTGAQTER